MTNYNEYRSDKNISNRDMIQAVRAGFPAYSKMQQSIVCNPAKNGVCLLPEAEELLVKRFGIGHGLGIVCKPRKRNHDTKGKPKRLTLRLSEAMFSEVDALMSRMCFSTMQDFLEAAVQQMLDRYGGAG